MSPGNKCYKIIYPKESFISYVKLLQMCHVGCPLWWQHWKEILKLYLLLTEWDVGDLEKHLQGMTDCHSAVTCWQGAVLLSVWKNGSLQQTCMCPRTARGRSLLELELRGSEAPTVRFQFQNP